MNGKLVLVVMATALGVFGMSQERQVYAAEDKAGEQQLDCPALASSRYDPDWGGPNAYCIGRKPFPSPAWGPVCKAINSYNPPGSFGGSAGLLDTISVGFWEDLQKAGKGTPYCKALLDTNAAFEKKLLQCGDNGPCTLKVLTDRSWQLNGLEKRFSGPALTRAMFAQYLGKDGQLAVGGGETLEQRAIRGLSISPLPKAILPQGVLYWGIEPHNAQTQSLVYSNSQGDVLALGLVDNLYYRYRAGEASKLPEDAGIRLFVRNPAVLSTLLPALRAWAAADLLGMNQTCQGAQAMNCRKALTVTVPITAYRLPCANGNLAACQLPLPKAKGEAPALNAFWQ
ncbi:hypothetical protein AB4090_13020 [Acidithiobacillus sp. IBUN Pt1247-S3]|uniref:hypothetical protein n=1 Tax=Acidithiobacillus sp. IBUN Pt1247-S3 TaxID=3166642 RepID=UPI0034E46D05